MNITVRCAVPEDRVRIMPLQKEIADLHHAGRPDLFRTEARFYSEANFNAMLAHPDHRIFIAEADGTVAGYVFAVIKHARNHSTYVDFDQFYIDDICVAERFRRHGIASALFERCTEQARADGCYNIELNVFCFNGDAIAFYEKMGMRPMIQRMEVIVAQKEEELT
ncbi:MAG: GNAT family N-acetyltransferase [Eubacteriales bacterium]